MSPEIQPGNVELVAEPIVTPEQPKPNFGKGSQAAVSALLVNLVALVGAILDAGSTWYQEPGIVTLVGTLIAGAVAFFGGRTSQVNRLVDQATAIVRKSSAQFELAKAAYDVEIAKTYPPIVVTPPAVPVPAEQPAGPDMGGAPDAGVQG